MRIWPSGGSGLYARGGDDHGAALVRALSARAGAHPRIRILTYTYAAGYYADHWVALVMRDCMVKMRARSLIVAQGAYEQPAVFRGNDLPGVLLASAAQRLLYRHAVLTARRVAVLTANARATRPLSMRSRMASSSPPCWICGRCPQRARVPRPMSSRVAACGCTSACSRSRLARSRAAAWRASNTAAPARHARATGSTSTACG